MGSYLVGYGLSFYLLESEHPQQLYLHQQEREFFSTTAEPDTKEGKGKGKGKGIFFFNLFYSSNIYYPRCLLLISLQAVFEILAIVERFKKRELLFFWVIRILIM